MTLTHLSNEELVKTLETLRGTERETTLAILYHLAELGKRESYRELGYSSLFDYCTRKLCYSGASVQRRIAGARCLQEHPELGELFLRGEVNLCTIATASQSLIENKTSVAEITGKSKREVEMIVAKLAPVAQKPREVVKPLVVATLPLLPQTEEERYALKFSVPREVFMKFEEVKRALSHTLGHEPTLEMVFAKLLDSYLKPRKRIKARPKKTQSKRSRHIPLAIKREVFERDEGRCTYTASDGTRCTAQHFLQYDHIRPFAAGGTAEPSNLRLRCAVHNRFHAEQYFGREFIQEKMAPKSFPPVVLPQGLVDNCP